MPESIGSAQRSQQSQLSPLQRFFASIARSQKGAETKEKERVEKKKAPGCAHFVPVGTHSSEDAA